MAARLSTDERVQIVSWNAEFANIQEVIRQWKKTFISQPPHKDTIRNVVKRFKETGSVHDRPRSGRSRSVVTEAAIENVRKKLEETSNLSIRVGALELGMSTGSYQRAVVEAGFRRFRPCKVQELSDEDFTRRKEFCLTMLALFNENPSMVDKIVWSDESKFMLNGTVNRHNCCYYAYSNQHQLLPVINSKDGVMVWCGLTSKGLMGPYFFDTSVTGETYVAMLQDFMWPLMKYRGLYFQQDGAPPHYSLIARSWLNEKFPNRWIGRGGPIKWPARSPDLTPPDFFLWGYLKDIVYKKRPSTCDELRSQIEQACAEIGKDMIARACQSVPSRLNRCLELEGRQLT